jgi:inner membrane transporter RhtA
VILAAWRRPWRAFAGRTGDERTLVLEWGAVLALMNACFYEAIDKLPLGTVAAIEFLPVILLAAAGARTARNVVALALAVLGVYLVTDVQLTGEPLGVAFAAANALLFALYITLAHRLAQDGAIDGTDALAASMLVAAIVITPLGGWSAVSAVGDPIALLAGVGVGLCSSVIPYVTDQLAMARLPRATYALMVSLLPATATVIGIVVLAQIPNAAEVAGVALVVAGVALHHQHATAPDSAPPPRATANEEAEALVTS